MKNTGDVGKWANSLQEAGLYVHWDDSGTIEYHDLEVDRQSPVIVAGKKKTILATLEGLEHLYTKDHPFVLKEGRSYKGALAEFAYHRVVEKTFFSGIQLKVTYHWHVFRLEIWESASFLLVYNYGNMGYHELHILTAGAFEDAQRMIDEAVDEFAHLGPMVWYHSLEERPE